MKYYTGIDFHLQKSVVTVMDQTGNIVNEATLHHADRDGIVNFFSALPPKTSVAIEATRNWYWMIDLLQELNLDVKLVHVKKARIIAESTIKTDKIDSAILAHLDRSNFLPTAYIADKETRSQRELLRFYMNLVKIRSSLKNRIHAVLAKNNIQHGHSDLFGTSGTEFLKNLQLPPMFQLELNGYLAVLGNINIQIKTAQKQIKLQCKESSYVKYLLSVPGVSYFSALLLSAEIADINRFRTYKKICSYAGLVSSTHQSADTCYQGHIIKDSNKYIRYVLVEAVPVAIRKDAALFNFYTRIKLKKGSKKAKIATARKMLVSIYSMLKNNQHYQFNKNINQMISVSKLGD